MESMTIQVAEISKMKIVKNVVKNEKKIIMDKQDCNIERKRKGNRFYVSAKQRVGEVNRKEKKNNTNNKVGIQSRFQSK